MANGLFQMTDREFWEQPTKGYDLMFEQIVLDKKPALVIDAPRIVDVSGPASVPVPVFYALLQKDSWGVELARDAVIVSSRLEDRGCWALTIRKMTGEDDEDLPDPSKLARPSGPPPEPERLEEQFMVTNLRETPMIPWERGTYDTRVIVRDRVSNEVRSKIQDPPQAYEDPEVARFLASQRQTAGIPRPVHPSPGDPLPSYGKRPDSPAVPAAPGIAFELPRIVLVQEGASALLRLSLRLPVLRGEHVPPAPPPPPDAPPRPPRPTAIVPVHLLLTGSEEPEPLLLTIRVPVWTSLDPALEGQEATGHATLDLFKLYRPLTEAKAQTFFVYALSGEVFQGPVLMALVSKDQLRR